MQPGKVSILRRHKWRHPTNLQYDLHAREYQQQCLNTTRQSFSIPCKLSSNRPCCHHQLPITDISEIDVTDQTSGHYRTEFRLGAFEDAYAKTGLIGDIAVDIVGYGWDKEDIRIYADGISLEQAKEIIKVASPILDTTLSESDIQDVMTFLDENQEANGYYDNVQ